MRLRACGYGLKPVCDVSVRTATRWPRGTSTIVSEAFVAAGHEGASSATAA